MEPEFEKNEVLEGATLKQWRRPVLRKLAISATEGSKGNLMREWEGGKAIPVQSRRDTTYHFTREFIDI